MADRFQGDPRITITEDGADLTFTGGQPVMDQGLENQAIISLFTAPGWWGNSLEPEPDKQIGSDFEATSREPITRDQLIRTRKAAISALKSPAFKNVDAFIDDKGYDRLAVRTLVTPPSGNEQQLLLNKSGANWISQRDDPANLK
jgi:phage gp46-like protein